MIDLTGRLAILITIDPKMIRDALLSLPDDERAVVVTAPLSGEKKVYTIARDGVTGKIAMNCKDEAEA